MHPFGCFGSSLAFAPTTAVCKGCDRFAECEALVTARRPQMLLLLSRFTDAKGEKMAVHWLEPEEKKKLKAMRKQSTLEAIEARVYGDRSIVMGLKASLDKRVHPLLDRMTKARINPKTQPLEAVAAFSVPMNKIISLLRDRPRTMQELTAELATECALSASTAQRDAYALVSILTVCDRAKRSGPLVELS